MKNYTKLFASSESESDIDLYNKILDKIENVSIRNARVRLWVVSSVSILSLAGFVFVFSYVGTQMQYSGFTSYLSLLSSGSAYLYWKEISLVLLESLPIFGVILLLGTLFTFLGSIKIAIRDLQVAKLSF